MYTVKGKRKSPNKEALQRAIREEGGAIVLKHALGMATAAYQVYPVGPPHTDGSPHTRDTFKLREGEIIIAQKGEFSQPAKNYVFNSSISNARKLSFLAKGASFFVEFGTIYMEARPILRTLIKRARKDITNSLRKINLASSGRKNK